MDSMESGGKKGMKKMMICVFLAFTMALLSGCSNFKEKYVSPEEMARLQSDAIITCVKNKDNDGLKNMFSKYIKETHDLDAEIAKFLNFINGKIVSYNSPQGGIGATSTSPEGTIRETLKGKIAEIKTDKNKTYLITFNMFSIFNEDEDYVGVCNVSIFDQDICDFESGYSLDDTVIIGEIVNF